MLRITQILRCLIPQGPPPSSRTAGGSGRGPVVIWNITRRCNLSCLHCYSSSKDVPYERELTTEEALRVLDDLASFRVQALILSGGEPLLREDVFLLIREARDRGIPTSLSTNGMLITPPVAREIRRSGLSYVGISLDGIGSVHDRFRRVDGAFRKTLEAVRLCRDQGVKVGLRFTLTRHNLADLPRLFHLMEEERIPKLYLSHLVYAGRGIRARDADLSLEETRFAVDYIIEKALQYALSGAIHEIVTGNNDADGVYLYLKLKDRFPEKAEILYRRLCAWGGNSSGVMLANLDSRGDVHPDPFWAHYTFGNVRERPFSAIWTDLSDPLMAALKRRPRRIKGRCAACRFMEICGGNTRVRAQCVTGDPWASDPACYLTDEEIGAAAPVAQAVGG